MPIAPINIYIPDSGTALQKALAGAQKSQNRFARAASNLTQGFAEAANAVSQATAPAVEAPTEAGAGLSAATALTTNNVNFAPEREIVDIITSQRAFEANLRVMDTAAEMQQEAIDVLA